MSFGLVFYFCRGCQVGACLYVFFLFFVELGWRALIGWFLGRGVGDLDVAGIGLEGVCKKLISLVCGSRFRG